METLAIIPARKNSKGVPGKNKMLINNLPLIEYSIKVALKCKQISKIIVTSDDDDIHKIVKKYKTILFHKRSKKLATDESPISETIYEVATNPNFKHYNNIIILQPTSPFRFPKQIDEAILKFNSKKRFNSLISVCKMNEIHPARMYHMRENLESLNKKYEKKRRQDIKPVYYRNGSIYIVKKNIFLKNKNLMSKPSLAFEMPYEQLLNIDTQLDIIIAKSLLKKFISNL